MSRSAFGRGFLPFRIAKLGKKKPMEEDSSIGVKYLKVSRKVLILLGYVVKVFPVWVKVFESYVKVFLERAAFTFKQETPITWQIPKVTGGENNLYVIKGVS